MQIRMTHPDNLPGIKHGILLLLTLLVSASCSQFNSRQQEPLAKVYNNYLYREDIADIFPANANPADSVKIARGYIDKWIRNQLFLRMAEVNLPEEEKNLDKQIADFKTSLLIYKYQQHLLNQKLDTVISVTELEEYFEDHQNNFILDKPAISGIFIKVPLDAPDRNNLAIWFRNENDLVRIENYSIQHAVGYAWFIDEWFFLDEVLKKLPQGSYDPNTNFTNLDHILAFDSQYQYFIGIRGYRPARSEMPFSLVSRKIEAIILNKRKIQFLNELEKNIMSEGSSKNAYQYFY